MSEFTDIQAMLMSQEGTGPMQSGRFMPYYDSKQLLTIGYGRCLDRKGISSNEALLLFQSDIADAVEDVRRLFSCYDQLSRPRQLVLISMAFNLGREKLSKFTRFISFVHLGKMEEAADEILDSKAARDDAPVRYAKLAKMWRQNVSEWV